jgi:hypothetical protein
MFAHMRKCLDATSTLPSFSGSLSRAHRNCGSLSLGMTEGESVAKVETIEMI